MSRTVLITGGSRGIGRAATTEEAAEAIVGPLSDAAPCATGISIDISGDR
jgi:NAD(P)-dependent dehydrogenase (short-subunit alcohol dehydrogenase family)